MMLNPLSIMEGGSDLGGADPAGEEGAYHVIPALTHDTYDSSEQGMVVADAETVEDLRRWAARVDENTLAAGGADFFSALLEKRSLTRVRDAIPVASILPGPGRRFFVCGSTSQYSREALRSAEDQGIPVCPMPEALFRKSQTDESLIYQWANVTLKAMQAGECAVIAVRQPVVQDADQARALAAHMACLVQTVIGKTAIRELFIEGGATADAILDQMEWNSLNVLGEYQAGVVRMGVPGQENPYVTSKPGSYTWPDSIWRRCKEGMLHAQ